MGWFNHQLGSLLQNMFFNIHPGKLTWNLKMKPWKRRFLLETIIFRFHVSFRRGTLLSLSEDLAQMAENEDDEAAQQLGGCGLAPTTNYRMWGAKNSTRSIVQVGAENVFDGFLHPGKLTCPLKRDYFSREYIFPPSIFRGVLVFVGVGGKNTKRNSLQGGNSLHLMFRWHCQQWNFLGWLSLWLSIFFRLMDIILLHRLI